MITSIQALQVHNITVEGFTERYYDRFDCNRLECRAEKVEAVVHCRTVNDRWDFLCEKHFNELGAELGPNKGHVILQILTPQERQEALIARALHTIKNMQGLNLRDVQKANLDIPGCTIRKHQPPFCQVGECRHKKQTSHYDAKTVYGCWQYLCHYHFTVFGVGLGPNMGQIILLQEPTQIDPRFRSKS